MGQIFRIDTFGQIPASPQRIFDIISENLLDSLMTYEKNIAFDVGLHSADCNQQCSCD